jgi:uncharacterized membrane protein
MSKAKKIGIVLILVGICLPVISLGFASGYYPTRGLIGNIQSMEIILREESYILTPWSEDTIDTGDTGRIIKEEDITNNFEPVPVKSKIAIPYKYIFAVGIVLVFSGIGIMVLSNTKQDRVTQ